MSSTTLYSYENTSITLTDAYKAWEIELAGAAVLCYSAMSCTVMTFEELKNYAFNSAAPFELRLFSAVGELRWLSHADNFDADSAKNNQGNAVYLTEAELSKEHNGWTLCQKSCVHNRSDYYVLWGEYENPKDNSFLFFEHRIGELRIPKSLFQDKKPDKKDKAVLKVKEYIAVTDDHGNCSVIAERLCGFDLLR